MGGDVIKAVLAGAETRECLQALGTERCFEVTLTPVPGTPTAPTAPTMVYQLTERHVGQLLDHLMAVLHGSTYRDRPEPGHDR